MVREHSQNCQSICTSIVQTLQPCTAGRKRTIYNEYIKRHAEVRVRLFLATRIIFVRWGKMACGRNAPRIDRADGCFARPRGRGQHCRGSGEPGASPQSNLMRRAQEVVTDSAVKMTCDWVVTFI